MVGKQQDRRVQNTRRLFREALITLLQENRYSTISIEDLADQANLGRTTFYLHYKDKDTLLDECLESVLLKLAEKLSSIPTTYWVSKDPWLIQILYEFASENEKFFKVILRDPCGFIFIQRLQKIVVDLLSQKAKEDIESLNTPRSIPLELLSTFYTGGILATIEWWVDNEKSYNEAHLVEMVTQVIEKSS